MYFILNIVMRLLVYKVIVIKCSLTRNGVIIEGENTITSAKQRLKLKYILRFCVIMSSNLNTCILKAVNTDNRAFVSPRTMKDFLLKTSLHEMVVCLVSMHKAYMTTSWQGNALLHYWPFEGNTPVTGGFRSRRTSNGALWYFLCC